MQQKECKRKLYICHSRHWSPRQADNMAGQKHDGEAQEHSPDHLHLLEGVAKAEAAIQRSRLS